MADPIAARDIWFDIAQKSITAIRTLGSNNTILIPGMNYTAASEFVTNGSAAKFLTLADPQNNLGVTVHCYLCDTGNPYSVSAPRDACLPLVTWARTHGVKVHIGEIAIDTEANGDPSAPPTYADAKAQWADWMQFCIEFNDVLIGWNWWANSAAGWWNAGDSQASHCWGLTLDNGRNQTKYMTLIQDSIAVPRLTIRDDPLDIGSEPNPTAGPLWMSPDVWPRQIDDNVTVGEEVIGGQPCYIKVAVTNRGGGGYVAAGNDAVHVYWSKASAITGWPVPWDGSTGMPPLGGRVGNPVLVGDLDQGHTKVITVRWDSPPDPANYGDDGHFCLLAVVGKLGVDPLESNTLSTADFGTPIQNLSNMAWHNIGIKRNGCRLGHLVIHNPFEKPMIASVRFQLLDTHARETEFEPGRLKVTQIQSPPTRVETLERIYVRRANLQQFEAPESGFKLELEPSGKRYFRVEFETYEQDRGWAIVATQSILEGDYETTIGGQTFVVGLVDGFTSHRENDPRRTGVGKRPLRSP